MAQLPSEQWSTSLGGSSFDALISVSERSNGEIYAGGNTTSSDGNPSGNAGGQDVWLAKFKANGALNWSKRLGGSQDERVFKVLTKSDGKMLALGYTQSTSGAFSQKGLFVAETSADGSNTTIHTIADSSAHATFLKLVDGSYVIASEFTGTMHGLTAVGISDIMLIKLNSSFQVVWRKSLGYSLKDQPRDLLLFQNAFYVLGTSGITGENDNVSLFKTDLNGNVQASANFGGSGSDWGAQFHIKNNQLFVQAGTQSVDGDVLGLQGPADIWFFSVDTNFSGLTENFTVGNSGGEVPAGMVLDPFFDTAIFFYYYPTDGTIAKLAETLALGGVSYDLTVGTVTPTQIIEGLDGSYILCGIKANPGNPDFWLAKWKKPCPSQIFLNNVSITGTFARSASVKIESNLSINSPSVVNYSAPAIFLNPGFTAPQGTIFTALPLGCL